jgi:alpha-tubulin suppressor-like RCC1 family protein
MSPTPTPTLIKELSGLGIEEIVGGEHNTLARTKDGKVFAWGRNDEGCIGVGDTIGEYKKFKVQEALDKLEE